MNMLPTVTYDFDGQFHALDAAIRVAAAAFQFQYTGPTVKFQNDKIPDLVYRLIRHYSARGFTCTYDGVLGTITIDWSHPNMTWQEQHEITRAVPEMIPSLGVAFRASMVYLCETNGVDLRGYTNTSILRELLPTIQEAATLGATEIKFGFPDVPAPALQTLFADTFTRLVELGFVITYNIEENLIFARWGHTLTFDMVSSETMQTSIT